MDALTLCQSVPRVSMTLLRFEAQGVIGRITPQEKQNGEAVSIRPKASK